MTCERKDKWIGGYSVTFFVDMPMAQIRPADTTIPQQATELIEVGQGEGEK